MLKKISTLVIASAFTFSLSGCAQNSFMGAESSKLLSTVISSSLNPNAQKGDTAKLLKQCAALQARISACSTLAQGVEQCISNAKAQSPGSDQCTL